MAASNNRILVYASTKNSNQNLRYSRTYPYPDVSVLNPLSPNNVEVLEERRLFSEARNYWARWLCMRRSSVLLTCCVDCMALSGLAHSFSLFQELCLLQFFVNLLERKLLPNIFSFILILVSDSTCFSKSIAHPYDYLSFRFCFRHYSGIYHIVPDEFKLSSEWNW